MTERDWAKASDEDVETAVSDWYVDSVNTFNRELARRYLARGEKLKEEKEINEMLDQEAKHAEEVAMKRGEEIKRLQEEKNLTFDSMVDHHETETTELQQTIDSHEAAMREALEVCAGDDYWPFREPKVREILRAELEKKS